MSISDSTAQHYTASDPDVRLMLQVRDGSATAFEELVQRYQRRLLTVLQHHVGHQSNAEDLAQEVFLRVYQSRKRYTPSAKFSTWLFTIAANVAKSSLRSQSRRKEVGGSQAMEVERLAQDASGLMPSRQLDRVEMSEIVSTAIESLGERQRMAILLSKFECMSYADIAATMDMTEKAVKSLLFRARENLKEALAPYMQDGVRPSSGNGNA